jgi:hypothetical protein
LPAPLDSTAVTTVCVCCTISKATARGI